MKKLAAILLLTVFTFNTVGYRLLFNWLENNTDKEFLAQLDAGNFNEEDLVVMSFPLNMPYQQADIVLERVNGEVILNGEVFKYVMRKVENGTLKLFCIPHDEKTNILEKINEFSGKVNDFPLADSHKKAENNKAPFSEFEEIQEQHTNNSAMLKTAFNSFINTQLPHPLLSSEAQPPEFLS